MKMLITGFAGFIGFHAAREFLRRGWNVVGIDNFCDYYDVKLKRDRAAKAPKLVYASSSSVYGGNRKMPFEESDQVDTPVSLYAATKKANELMAHTYSHLYGMQTIGLRFFTVYGAWYRPDMALSLFADAMLHKAVGYAPTTTIREGIPVFAKWYREYHGL